MLFDSFRFAMLATLLVFAAATSAAAESTGTVRTYYIAADEVNWNYFPGGVDLMMGMKPSGYASVWMFHCHVSEHMQGGMTAMYEVTP